MIQSINRSDTFKDKLVPCYIILFFISFTALLSGFAMIAHRTYNGVITENAYKKGLAYNSIIKEANDEKELKWKSKMELKTRADNHLDINFSLNDKLGNPIIDASVEAWIIRPSKSGSDSKVALKELSKGKYSTNAELPLQGVWDIVISATKNNNNFQESQRIIMK